MTDADDALARLRNTSPVSRRDQFRRLLWSLVEATLYGCSFHTFSGWRAWLLRRFGARIGRHCTIRRTSRIYYPWRLELGDNSSLGDRCQIYNLAQIMIGQRVTISQEAYLCAGTHDITKQTMPLVTKPIRIGDEAWICARAFINPGVVVGAGAVVAAGAVVTKNVAQWAIVGGNPAKFIKNRTRPV